jgi:hypothetical protein
MKTTARILPVLALAATASIAWIAAGAAASVRPQAAPSLTTPEHKLFEKYAGTWDAECTMNTPDGKSEKSAAKSTSRVICGGLWQVTDFEGSMMGAPFQGHEVLGFDPAAKHYVVTWVDSAGASPSTGELDFDATTKTLAGRLKGRDEKGAEVTWRQTDTWKDDNTHEWTMYMAGPDGKESVAIQILYKRQK